MDNIKKAILRSKLEIGDVINYLDSNSSIVRMQVIRDFFPRNLFDDRGWIIFEDKTHIPVEYAISRMKNNEEELLY